MPELNTVTLQTLVPKSLAQIVLQQSMDEGLSISAYVRRILTIWHDPDQGTVEKCCKEGGK